MDNWDSYERAAQHGPGTIIAKIIILIVVIAAVIGGLGYAFGWFSETAQVAQNEFGPAAMLKKYEWFKDAAAMLDKKKADIDIYEARLKAMADTYTDTPRASWAREDREQYNVWNSEVAGVKASYNTLAADYNAQMAKFNWRFTNTGELPEGSNQPLPREFKPYTNQ